MDASRVAKKVYNELLNLNNIGFPNWMTKVSELVSAYDLDIDQNPEEFRILCKNRVIDKFLITWQNELCDIKKIQSYAYILT